MSSETTSVREDGRIVENNFDTLPTHVPGLRILVDHGEDAQELTRGATVELRDMATPYVERAEAIKGLTQLQKVPHDRFVEIGQGLPGLRGVRDMESGVEVQINPRAENVFDEKAIRRSLGDRAQEVLHRKVTVTVELDPDKDNVNGFVRSMERRLQRQGSKAEVKTTESTRVDAEALWDMIKDDDVALASGAWEVRTVGHSIVPRKIASNRDLEIAEREALGSQDQSLRESDRNAMRGDFRQRFTEMSEEELVDAFNREVGNSGWVGARGEYLFALQEELGKRGIDFSAVGDESRLSLTNRVFLSKDRKLIPTPDQLTET